MNKVKCVYYSLSHSFFSQQSLTFGEYYEYKKINNRTGKIYIKNNVGIFKFYPISWFEFSVKFVRRMKLSSLKNSY